MSEIIFVESGSQKERLLKNAYNMGILSECPIETTSSVAASLGMRSYKISERDILRNPETIRILRNLW